MITASMGMKRKCWALQTDIACGGRRTRNTAMLHENVYSKAGTGRDRFRQ